MIRVRERKGRVYLEFGDDLGSRTTVDERDEPQVRKHFFVVRVEHLRTGEGGREGFSAKLVSKKKKKTDGQSPQDVARSRFLTRRRTLFALARFRETVDFTDPRVTRDKVGLVEDVPPRDDLGRDVEQLAVRRRLCVVRVGEARLELGREERRERRRGFEEEFEHGNERRGGGRVHEERDARRRQVVHQSTIAFRGMTVARDKESLPRLMSRSMSE